MNTRKKIFVFLFFSMIAAAGFSQLRPVYIFQKDDTILRQKFYEQSLQKKNQLINSLGTENQSDYKKIYEDRFKEISALWLSQRPVTSPEALAYLQTILRRIISVNPELKGMDARVVFSRDWWPNAFSMGDGTITINAGLLVYLDNEAQLAFVICHELSHYYLDHSNKAIKKYVETVNSEDFKKEIKRLSKEQYRVNQQLEQLTKSIAFDSRRHSRNNEAEADRQGFIFMKKTGYDCGAIKTCLQLLDRVDDSLLYKPLNLPQLFNFPGYAFKDKWIQKESTIFAQLDENDSPLSPKERDSLKTHPDCAQRILLLADSLQAISQDGKKFLVNEQLFRQLKKNFFNEMTEQCYRANNLSRNLYYSLAMLQAQENIPLAVYSIARCLNDIYKSQQSHTLGTRVDAESKGFSEDYNLLLRMISRLRLDEIASLNYYFCNQYQITMEGYAGFQEELRKIQRPRN